MGSPVAAGCWFSWCHWGWSVWSWPVRQVYCCYDLWVYWCFPSYSQSSTPPSWHLEHTRIERKEKTKRLIEIEIKLCRCAVQYSLIITGCTVYFVFFRAWFDDPTHLSHSKSGKSVKRSNLAPQEFYNNAAILRKLLQASEIPEDGWKFVLFKSSLFFPPFLFP